jgi:NAD(P)-dependent dehydrogenase (short-subunit alcohol dehydrogenase family)
MTQITRPMESIIAPTMQLTAGQPTQLLLRFLSADFENQIKRNLIATRAAWQATLDPQLRIDSIVFGEGVRLLKNEKKLLPLSVCFAIINHIMSNLEANTTIDNVASKAFALAQQGPDTSRMNAVCAAKSAVMYYLQSPQ